MKQLISFLALLFASVVGYSQSYYFLRADTITIEKAGANGELILKNAGRDSQKGGVLYNTGGGRTAFKKTVALNDSTIIVGGDTVVIKGGIKGGSALDTTSLSARIDARVKYSDTLLMLYPYLRKNDTASLSNRIDLRVKYSDTAAMLAIYLRKSDTVSLNNRIEQRMKYSDTVSLSNRIDGKQPTGNYITGLNGDVSATGPGLANAVLSPTSITPGTYNLATVTFDQKGRGTFAANGVVAQLTDSTFRINNDTITIKGTERVSEWVSVTDYGARPNDTLTDYTTNIQAALSSGARTVLIPTGLYILTNSIKINSNQTLIGYGAKLIRKTNTGAMIINLTDSVTGGYDADSNMAIIGITFEGNGVNYPTSGYGGGTLIVFGHSKNITIRDCDLTNPPIFHCIEINSSKNALIDNCTFHDANTLSSTRELLQIDLAQNVAAFPWYGPYDNTPCDGVIVRNCKFLNTTGCGVGTHNATNTYLQKNILIEGCYFENLAGVGVLTYNYSGLTVRNNVIKNCRRAIRDFNGIAFPGQGRVLIEGNVITEMLKTTGDALAIQLNYYKGITIKNNIIDSIRSVAISLNTCDSIEIVNNTINEYGTGLANIANAIELNSSTNGSINSNKIQSEVTTFRRDAIAVLGTSKNISIVENIIKLPSLAKQAGASAFGQHNPIAGTNIYIGHNIVNDTAIGNTIPVTTTYTTTGTERVITANTTGGAFGITVQPRLLNEGITIIKTAGAASTLTVTPNSGTINGASSIIVDSTVTIRSDGFNYYTLGGGSGGGVTDHGALTGLADDDHTQYALLAGRSGGQTLKGGTATTDDLILQSTSGVGASGADIIFRGGSNGATEFARFLNNGNFGLGTNNPSAPFELTTASQTGVKVNMSNTADGTHAVLFNRTSTASELAFGFQTAGVDKWFFGMNQSSGDLLMPYNWAGNKLALTIKDITGHVLWGNSQLSALMNDGTLGVKTTTTTAYLHIGAGTATANTAPIKLTAGTNLTTPEAGAIEFDGTHYYGTIGSTRHQLDQNGITSINSQTGPAITVQSGTATSVSTAANAITVNVFPASLALPHPLNKQYSDVSNTGTSETDLYTYTVPDNTLTINGRSVHFEMVGTFNDATATANIKFYFGGTSFGTTGVLTLSQTGAWCATGFIIRTGTTTGRAYVTMSTPGASTASYTNELDLTGLDWTIGNILKVTAQAGGAGGGSNDITQKAWVVRYEPE